MTQDIAQRIVNAEDCFAQILTEQFSVTREDAHKARSVFSKHKLIKLDAVGGRYIVKTSAIFDKEVIERAIEEFDGN